MEDLQLALTTARTDQRNFGLWINNWQIGQTLNALVIGQRPGGELVLRVAGQQITATADIPVQPGANLLLEVKQLRPVPTLQVINPTPEVGPGKFGGTLQLLSASGSGVTSLPLASVAQALQTSQASMALPGGLAGAVALILRQVSRPEQLAQAEGLARAVLESGVLFESNVRSAAQSGSAPPPADMKGGFFQALASVNAALARVEALALSSVDVDALLAMKRDLEGAVARITLNQLNSLPAENSSVRHWQLEIPMQMAGNFHSLRIEIEQERGEAGGTGQEQEQERDRWSMTLRLSPPAVGAVEVRLQLQDQEVNVTFVVAHAGVRKMIDAGIPTLAAALASRGLTLTSGITSELQKSPPAAQENADDRRALDLRA